MPKKAVTKKEYDLKLVLLLHMPKKAVTKIVLRC